MAFHLVFGAEIYIWEYLQRWKIDIIKIYTNKIWLNNIQDEISTLIKMIIVINIKIFKTLILNPLFINWLYIGVIFSIKVV